MPITEGYSFELKAEGKQIPETVQSLGNFFLKRRKITIDLITGLGLDHAYTYITEHFLYAENPNSLKMN